MMPGRGLRGHARPTSDPVVQEVAAVAEVTKARRKRIATFIEPLRVQPGSRVDLGQGLRPRLPASS